MMDRANYKKVLKTLGYDEIYNCPSGSCMDFGSCTRIDIDNTSGKATEAIERIISYVDALLYEVDIKEPAGATDRFTFILDDERYSLDIDYMAQDADDEDWKCWQFLRSEILSAKQIHIEYRYVGDADVAEDLLETGLKHMLDDVLADGMLANCVRFCIQIATGGSDEGEGLEAHCRRYLWINGIHNGQYICGEIPFEKNDELIRSCGGWRQSDSACNDCDGIFLNLHPRTSPLLLNRLRKCIKDFTRKIHCNAEIMLSPEEYRRRYMDDVSSYITPSMTDKAMDDKEQKEFPDLRKYFSADEVDCLLNRYPTLSRLYVKHADESYTTDDLERIRFLWTLVLMGELEGENRTVKRSNGVWDKINPTNDYMKVFYQLPEDIRLRLYGTSEYERTTSFGRERLIPTTNNFGTKFINTHTGLGDLSIMEEAVKGYIWGCGYGVHINMIYLSGIEDVRLMCSFLNELKEIERLAQEETGKPLQVTENRFVQRSVAAPWFRFDSIGMSEEEADLTGSELENLKDIPKQTLRDYYAQIEMSVLENMNIMTVNDKDNIEDDDVTFESEDRDNWSRLRFRLEDDKYICEIAQVDA